MTFKQLLKEVHKMRSEEEFNMTCAEIDRSFENGKINFADHEDLYDLACWVWKGKRDGSYVRSI